MGSVGDWPAESAESEEAAVALEEPRVVAVRQPMENHDAEEGVGRREFE